MFGISEIAIILIVVILVVGAKKLPELARSAGKSARIFKAEARAMKNTDADNTTEPAPRVISGETLPLGALSRARALSDACPTDGVCGCAHSRAHRPARSPRNRNAGARVGFSTEMRGAPVGGHPAVTLAAKASRLSDMRARRSSMVRDSSYRA